MARQMKDSGVEWMGAIPKEWKVVKCKHLATVQAGFPFDSAKFSNSEGTPLIRIRDITSGFTQTYYSEEYDSAYIVSKGDLLIGMDGDFNIRMWQSENALLNQRCCRVLSNSDIELSFLYYSLPFHLEITNNLAYATTVKHLSNSDVLNAPIPYPSKSIRGRIISFLNNKCAEIDKVVEQTRATIEEYKKLKQAIITEAVTKGVRGPRPMKPSGVEWIGDIPEEWSRKKIGHVATFFNGDRTKRYPQPSDFVEKGVPFINSSNLDNDELNVTQCKYITSDKYNSLSGAKIKIKDIIICLRGSIGKCCINNIISEGTVASSLAVIRSRDVLPEYLLYCLLSDVAIKQTDINMNGTCAANLAAESVAGYFIPVPLISEQQEIATYLDTKCAEIDRIIEKKEQLIEELGSYKKSLIYEYVTGKKEVTA